MEQYRVTFEPKHITVSVAPGTTLLHAEIIAGLHPDAPCGGRGTCGKCRVWLEGKEILACQTIVSRDMTVYTQEDTGLNILIDGVSADVCPDSESRYALAYDIGTTTVVAYLLDGISGQLLANASCMNPQGQFGADVISRIQYVLDGGGVEVQNCIRTALTKLTQDAAKQAGISPADISLASIVGNTAMHHLLLGIDPKPLVTPPYMPGIFEALELDAAQLLPFSGKVRILPNIAGFVGGDTVGCMVSTRFDQLDELTLLIDIGTNGEMVLGNRHRRIACSTAAGPAFEGARISCGMRGAPGAVDHITLENGVIQHHVIGETYGIGLCGSGLLDLVAVLLDAGILDESGYLEDKEYHLEGTDVILTQKDVREVQLAKAAIRAGIELLAQQMDVHVADIQKVYLAGAFGNYLNPASACRIGMIPPVLIDRIIPIGNAAGEGAKMCALSRAEFEYSKSLAEHTEFLELASLPDFQDCYVDALQFEEEEE